MTPAPAIQKRPKKWVPRQIDHVRAAELANSLGVSPIVGGLLAARGYGDVSTAEVFLKPSLEHLHDPFLIRGMPAAVARVLHAIDHQEPSPVLGQHAVDGAA